jgi:hypothetical protein
MSTSTVGLVAEDVTEVIGDALSTGIELATEAARHLPDVGERVGSIARSSAETVADLATTALSLAPFVGRESRVRRRPWWLVPAIVLGVLVAFAVWKKRSAREDTTAADSGPTNVSSLDRPSAAASG